MTDPQPEERGVPDRVRIRRSSRISNFLLVGALLGAVVAFILTIAFPANDSFPSGQVFGLLLLAGLALGGALGGVVALLFDRAFARRAREVEAERLEGAALPVEPGVGPDFEPGAVPRAEPDIEPRAAEPIDEAPRASGAPDDVPPAGETRS